MTDERRRELELVAEVVLSKADLKVTKEISNVREEMSDLRQEVRSIPPLMDKKIQEYDYQQIKRRQWVARTIIAIAALGLTGVGLFLAQHFGG